MIGDLAEYVVGEREGEPVYVVVGNVEVIVDETLLEKDWLTIWETIVLMWATRRARSMESLWECLSGTMSAKLIARQWVLLRKTNLHVRLLFPS